MNTAISKKFSNVQRKIIKEVLRLAHHDFDLLGLRSLRIAPLNAQEQEHFGGYAHVHDNKGTVKMARNQKSADFIESLAHELAHVAQYARGDLTDTRYFAIWKGWLCIPHKILFDIRPFGDIKYNPIYWFSPWEIEARKYAAKIMQEIENV